MDLDKLQEDNDDEEKINEENEDKGILMPEIKEK